MMKKIFSLLTFLTIVISNSLHARVTVAQEKNFNNTLIQPTKIIRLPSAQKPAPVLQQNPIIALAKSTSASLPKSTAQPNAIVPGKKRSSASSSSQSSVATVDPVVATAIKSTTSPSSSAKTSTTKKKKK